MTQMRREDATTDRVSMLSDVKQELLRRRLRERASVQRGVPVVSRDEPLLPSFQQEGLWFLDRLDPGQTVYNVPFALRLRGELDVTALRSGLGLLTARHEALRTRFTTAGDGSPRLLIDAAGDGPDLPVIDLSTAEDPFTEAVRHADTEAQRPFDLATGPLLRAALLRLHTDDHVLLLSLHHAVTDGWSVSILTHELSEAYQALTQGRQPQLPPLTVQPADVAAWQRRQLTGDTLREHLTYWEHNLRDLPTLDLPTDRPRPAERTWAGASYRAHLPRDLGHRLRRLATDHNASLLATLLAGFTVVLSRYTGQSDITVGSVFSGRHHPEVEPLVGYFANTVVLRTDLTGDPDFHTLINRCNDTVLGALQHQDIPFSTLVSHLKPPRDPSRNPLFQTSFSLRSSGPADSGFGLGEVPGEMLPFHTTRSRFDMTVTAIQGPDDELEVLVEYSTELFGEGRVRRLVAHLGRVLAAAVADPGLPVSRLPLLDEEEQRLLDSFNDTAVDYGPAACLHETISRQAARTPDAVAVRYAGADLTYAQLDRRANQLARHLIDLGAGPDRLVGICAQRSTELVVALLATLKAGAAYVPLDPDHPRERLRYLIDDTGVPVVLTQHHLTDRLPATTAHLALDTDWPTVATHPDTPPETTVTPDNLAYVIYTSGSTGQPKGVMVEHRAIDNRLRWMQHTYPLHAHDAVLQKTPYTFDVSVWEFFWPLMVGARLVLARPEGHRDNAYLTHTITSENITTVHFVPAMLRHFLNHLDTTTAPTTLTRVFCSGEALTADLRDRFFTHLDAELHNLYGPTEAAVDVTYWQCHPHHTDPTIPIGRPIANTQCHVLDPHHQPTPIGIPGELHLAGTCLARGYHHRDDLTHHTFITHPTTGQRLYRTGDIATWNPDGTLEYLGRNDHQVKINGQRIELGEIENTLTTHPHINHAIAGTHQPDPHTTPHLIAWITTDHPHPDQLTTDLRTWLTDHLPLHLIPATITPITHLPLTTSGKIDRKQLPLPHTDTPTHHRPHTPTEHTLATIWTTLTNNPNPQPHDNFFTTGGNSLHAIQLITHIHNHFRITLPLRTLYTHPTLTTMATAIDTVRTDGADRATASSLVPLRAEGSRTPLHLVHPVGGSVVPYLPLVALLPSDLPVWGFEAAGLHDGEPGADLTEMAARYVAELRRRQPHGPYRLGGWSFGGMVAYEMARRLTRDGERVELLLLLDTSSPAGDGPLPDDTDLLIDFAEDVAALQDADVPALDRDRLAALPPDERTAAVLAALRERGLVPAEAVDEMARRSAVFRANALAFRRYRPAPYDGVVSLLTAEGSGDHHTRRWIEANLARVEHRRVPGTHYSMLREPHLTDVASIIDDLIHERS